MSKWHTIINKCLYHIFMVKYIVTACSISRGSIFKTMECVRKDGKKGLFYSDELVDTSDNGQAVFGAKNFYEVEDKYESFWNRIIGGYNNREIVKVLEVRPARNGVDF